MEARGAFSAQLMTDVVQYVLQVVRGALNVLLLSLESLAEFLW